MDFCEDVFTWMEANRENVIVVHCKGGKGKVSSARASKPHYLLVLYWFGRSNWDNDFVMAGASRPLFGCR